MFPPTTRGWFMVAPSWHGRDGIHTLEFGLAVLTSRLESALESAGTAVLAGAGVIGDLIGMADMQSTTMAVTTQGAEHSITGAHTIEVELTLSAAALTPALGTLADTAEFTTVPEPCPGLLTETPKRLEDTRHPTVKAVSVRAPSAVTIMAGRPGAIRRVEAPVTAAEASMEVAEDPMVAAAVVGNRRLVFSSW